MKKITRVILWVILYPFSCLACPTYDVIFHDTACIKPYKNYEYQTCHDITITIDHFILKIPKNFDTDLASIPRWLWIIIAPSRSDIISPAILHDYLYSCHKGYSRKEIDTIFYNALIRNGVSQIRAYEMYFAVRIFGGNHYGLKELC